MNMSGSFLPGLGRQPKSTRVEGADIVMQSCAFTLQVSRPTRVEWRHEVFAMREEESASADLERLCQGISPDVGACTYPATVRCPSCQKWFCDAHAEDGQWHPCMLPGQ